MCTGLKLHEYESLATRTNERTRSRVYVNGALICFLTGKIINICGGVFVYKILCGKMKKQKPLCKYGDKCYRKNPQHFREYSHATQSESEVELNLRIGSGPNR